MSFWKVFFPNKKLFVKSMAKDSLTWGTCLCRQSLQFLIVHKKVRFLSAWNYNRFLSGLKWHLCFRYPGHIGACQASLGHAMPCLGLLGNGWVRNKMRTYREHYFRFVHKHKSPSQQIFTSNSWGKCQGRNIMLLCCNG